MRALKIAVKFAAGKNSKGDKSWPAADFVAVAQVPENEEEFKKVSGGMSSFDFAVSQFEKKVENAGTQAFKNNASPDVEVRVKKSQEAVANYTLNSRGEGARTLANEAANHLDGITDPKVRAAMEALINKVKGND